jgi:hypothetical protein
MAPRNAARSAAAFELRPATIASGTSLDMPGLMMRFAEDSRGVLRPLSHHDRVHRRRHGPAVGRGSLVTRVLLPDSGKFVGNGLCPAAAARHCVLRPAFKRPSDRETSIIFITDIFWVFVYFPQR